VLEHIARIQIFLYICEVESNQERDMSIFSDDMRPAHEKYRFGQLRVGDESMVLQSETREPLEKVRRHISAHGQYYGKKFRTKILGDTLHIKRVK